jgi:4-hydroxy-4-methyl-2-oxoglutarate aldolase
MATAAAGTTRTTRTTGTTNGTTTGSTASTGSSATTPIEPVPYRPGEPGTPTLAELIERYRRLESAVIYDVLDHMGLPDQQLSLEITPLHVDMVVAGEAYTEKYVATPPDAGFKQGAATPTPDFPEGRYPGCVVVQDVGMDPISGGLGENAGIGARMAGAEGVVCDGGTRDRKALIKYGFPVFSRFSTCTLSWSRRKQVARQVPVRLSGHLTRWVTVHPGDFIFGDCDGILVIPRALTLEVLVASERVAEIEEEQRDGLLAGIPRPSNFQVMRYAHVRRVVQEPDFR